MAAATIAMFQPGDRHDVADAGGRERGREVAIDPVAKADEDARGETGLGLGEDAGQRLAGAAAQTLEPPTEVVRGRRDLERPGPKVPTAPMRSR